MNRFFLLCVLLAPVPAWADRGTSTVALDSTLVVDGDARGANYLYTVAAVHRGVQARAPLATVLDLEVGRGSAGGWYYDANVGVGLGVRLGDRVAVGLTLGFGVSGLTGDRIPFAIQVPVELFLLASTGERAHMVTYARGAKVYHDRRESAGLIEAADVLTAGLGWVLPSPERTYGVFIGVEAQQMLGTEAYSFLIGIGRHRAQ